MSDFDLLKDKFNDKYNVLGIYIYNNKLNEKVYALSVDYLPEKDVEDIKKLGFEIVSISHILISFDERGYYIVYLRRVKK